MNQPSNSIPPRKWQTFSFPVPPDYRAVFNLYSEGQEFRIVALNSRWRIDAWPAGTTKNQRQVLDWVCACFDQMRMECAEKKGVVL